MSTLVKPLAVAVASAALSLAVIEAKPAEAATLTYDFAVDIEEGPLAGETFLGSGTYDDADLSPAYSGQPIDTNLSFLFDGFEYTNENEAFPGSTYLTVNDDLEVKSLNFFGQRNGELIFSFSFSNDIFLYGYNTENLSSGKVTFNPDITPPPPSPTPVPEPSMVLSFGVLALGGLWRRNKGISKSSQERQ